jgi:hypothetical protein
LVIARAGADRIADLEPLYRALHMHHTTVAPRLGGIAAREVAASWQRRRSKYEAWMAAPSAFVLLAERGETLVGFALVTVGDGYDAWASHDRVADVRDLVVVPPEGIWRGHDVDGRAGA